MDLQDTQQRVNIDRLSLVRQRRTRIVDRQVPNLVGCLQILHVVEKIQSAQNAPVLARLGKARVASALTRGKADRRIGAGPPMTIGWVEPAVGSVAQNVGFIGRDQAEIFPDIFLCVVDTRLRCMKSQFLPQFVARHTLLEHADAHREKHHQREKYQDHDTGEGCHDTGLQPGRCVFFKPISVHFLDLFDERVSCSKSEPANRSGR